SRGALAGSRPDTTPASASRRSPPSWRPAVRGLRRAASVSSGGHPEQNAPGIQAACRSPSNRERDTCLHGDNNLERRLFWRAEPKKSIIARGIFSVESSLREGRAQ